MDIREMVEESVAFNLAGGKTPLSDVLHLSTPSNTQFSAVMAFLSMAVLAKASTVVATGMFSGTGSLSSLTANTSFPSTKKLSLFIFCPALTLSGSNCISSELYSRYRSIAALLSLLHQIGDSNKLYDGPYAVMVTF